MAYTKTVWRDHVVSRPNVYTLVDNGDDTVTLTPSEGTILQEGTPVNAANLNKIEDELVTLDTRTYALGGNYITGTLPLTKGGTGETTRAAALNTLANLGTTPISSTANDTVGNWRDLRAGIAWYNASGNLNGQPSQYGLLINLNTTASQSDVHQIWAAQSNGSLFHRGGNTSGWGSTDWKTILDSSNYTSFVTLSSIGAAASGHTHALTSTSITGTLGVGKGGTGATTFTSGAALIGNGTGAIQTRSILNNTSKTYVTTGTDLINKNTLAYWNGAYNSSNSSNISYVGTISGGIWHGTKVGIEYGGTNATTAADARTNLGITPANIGAAAASHTHSYLPLSGGTLTGSVTTKISSWDNTTAPSSAKSFDNRTFTDNNNYSIMFERIHQDASNNAGVEYGVRRQVSSSSILWHSLKLMVSPTGTKTVSLDRPSWHAGLGIVQGYVAQAALAANTAEAVKTISFGMTFSSAPNVVVGMLATGDSSGLGGCNVIVTATTTTGFSYRRVNNTSSSRTFGLTWIAAGK